MAQESIGTIHYIIIDQIKETKDEKNAGGVIHPNLLRNKNDAIFFLHQL